ncbi:UDP-4-amino-4,6-dideoxy-N-acetyl-beta-L-altrosamine N-acetyltransferase [Helicobacter anatolicus]|uniref:UDP-4-amino-4, 6-dideoxy-N-acetyl-beta-L-altrosamine N-acetyltransferase n=1 Tax=Helicobacter anatolicus TaxID=2905874 RepID=UPI001E44D382|nr:UDP-4-amino-4,6-dideoxy-N-acetyl-beta-L-altrosamine N-acetyltransferase [Helicobacter anatolicus]MCE3039498.1 UDP-4-amino-4,6-dideoxy-N-acetyl-beta-L-altrosamine N-acetyltransferase [Helicobacter anatolicus]
MAKIFTFNGVQAINFVDLKEKEIYKVLEFRNHPEICKWMYNSSILSLQAHLDFLESLKTTPSTCYWVFKKDEEFLGVGSLKRINIAHKNAYLGIYKNPEKKGVGDEILQFLEYIAFDSFGLHSLVLEVIASNKKAIACYERNKFVHTGTLKEYIFMNKKYQDVLIYGKINAK